METTRVLLQVPVRGVGTQEASTCGPEKSFRKESMHCRGWRRTSGTGATISLPAYADCPGTTWSTPIPVRISPEDHPRHTTKGVIHHFQHRSRSEEVCEVAATDDEGRERARTRTIRFAGSGQP
jgi:hypothetical protein